MTDRTDSAQTSKDAGGPGLDIRPIAPSEREAVADLLREAEPSARATSRIATLATLPEGQVFAALREGTLVAAYALRRDGMANDLAIIAVRPGHRRQGIGRTLLQDALRRSGRRPLAAQVPDDVLPFFRACGFKLVGRRVQPDGEVHFRVGWHAPAPRPAGGAALLDHRRTDDRSQG